MTENTGKKSYQQLEPKNIAMLSNGRTFEEVGKMLGVSGSTVGNWIKSGAASETAEKLAGYILASQSKPQLIICRPDTETKLTLLKTFCTGANVRFMHLTE